MVFSLPAGIFDNLKVLETLEMSEANLTTLPNGALLPLLNLTTLSLNGNPFVCDCSLQWLGYYLYDTGKRFSLNLFTYGRLQSKLSQLISITFDRLF